MRFKKYYILTSVLVLFAICSKAQSPLNGRFYISGVSEVPSTPASNYSIEGDFTDMTYIYTAADVKVGDVIADNVGLTFRIDKITSLKGEQITADVTYLRGSTVAGLSYPTAYASGTLFRPTSKGYAMATYDAENINDKLKIAVQNAAILDIDRDIRGFKSGSDTEIPKDPKFGDLYYNVTDKKLYAFTANGWVPLGSGIIASGSAGEFPNPTKIGEMFFNKDDNNTYIYNGGVWFKISTNGSTPGGNINPDPSAAPVKGGDLFYNVSDHKLYVYNGTAWMSINNALRNGQIFVGNASNVATSVALSGDATITNAGKLTIKDLAVTDEKLDKLNIPLSGFGNPSDNVSMGDGSTNFRITNLGNPSAASDAATKSYVDILFTDPAILGLTNNSFFVGNSANKAVAVAKNLIPVSGFDKATANVSMGTGTTGGNFKIVNLADPTAAQDAATKNYVDNRQTNASNLILSKGNLLVGGDANLAVQIAKNAIPLNGFGTPVADLAIGGFKLTGLAEPAAAQDAVTKNYVDTKVISPANISLATGYLFAGDAAGKASEVLKSSIPLSEFGKPTADILMGGFTLGNLAAPVADEDASTKKYVDDIFKAPASLLALPAGNFFVGNASGKAAATLKSQIPVSGFAKAAETLYMGDATTQFGISFLKNPTFDQDAATKKYVDDKIAAPGALVLEDDHIFVGDASNKAVAVNKNAIPLSDFGNALKDLSIGNGTTNFKITNLADPTADQEAATKKYVDSKSTKTPVGPTAPGTAVAGDTYYNTADNRLYVYNGKDWVPVDNKLNNTELYVGDVKGNAVSTPKTSVPLSGFGTPAADISFGNFKLTTLADPLADQDAATKKYVDSKTTKTPVGPTAPGTAVAGDTYYNTADNRLYVYNGKDWVPMDNKLADQNLYVGNASGIAVSTPKNVIPLSGFGSAQADVSMGNFKLTNLVDPIANQDAATKKYVDAGLLTAGANAKDNLGNHKATESIKLSVYAISNDGVDGKGLTFDTQGNASFGQDVTVNGNFYTPSDKRLKTNIETLGNVLQKIDQLRGVKFEYKDQHKYASGSKIGVIAQELQKVYPAMVTTGKDGFLKVDYTQLTGMLIQAVKEQQKQIEELQTRMNNQQEQINSILKKIQ
ncbi:tail fiber domain-containing protein [Pedobacter cryoconitis]|uniref:tail fiber domain-containing protein n=1 Tax=Pedobacter cryoconitis TaxID=188932 RepID=UPI001609745B|nr:tail fiber domain-containing protein [Pedobacter cryoconitis]MBB5647511.1 hypothetical protein [Pedobacter cryoconitis]